MRINEVISFGDTFHSMGRQMYDQLIKTLYVYSDAVRPGMPILKARVENIIQFCLEDHDFPNTKVIFTELNSDGNYSELNSSLTSRESLIQLNVKYYTALEHFVFNKLKSKPKDITFNNFKYELSPGVKNFINIIMPVIMHEVTHWSQWENTSIRGKSGFEHYRSYMIKNIHVFRLLLRTTEKSLEKRMAYLASPQEIDAFAKTMVYSWMSKVLDVDKNIDADLAIKVLDEVIKVFPKLVTRDLGNEYKNKFANKYPKIYQRFVKKVYQELMSVYEFYDKHDNTIDKRIRNKVEYPYLDKY